MNLKNLSFVIVTHVYATGPAFRLEEYLQKKVKSLIFIGHPFSYTKDNRSFIRKYKDGKLIKEEKFICWKSPEILFWVKDLLLTLWWVVKETKKSDYLIGVDNLNAFAGYILKLFGKVNKFVFYVIDYIPERFDNKLLNSLYHYLDRLAVKKSDKVWNLSSVMMAEREKRGISADYRNKQITVPIGTDISKYAKTFDQIDKEKIVFMGHLREGQGVELLIDSIPEIVKKVSKAYLLVIGGGPLEEKFKKNVEIKNLSRNVKFTGFIKEYTEVEKLLSDAAVAVAPYVDDNKTYTKYTDPGKPKDYLASGIPVVITKVPRVACEIEKNKCGIAINYDRKELAGAIIKLLTNRTLLSEFKTNSLKMAHKYAWNKVFDKAIRETI